MTTMEGALLRSLAWEHERVAIARDARSGMQAVIAIHSTALGPALGGLRIRPYEGGMPEALDDALRLARAMTLKASLAGLDLGGGKAVMLDDGCAARRPARLAALAQEVERLDGAYITAEDVGTTMADMDLIAEHTRHVVGRTSHGAIGGDPSPATARTVLGAIRAALGALDGDDALPGRVVGVVGLGKVGGELAALLAHAGARVVGYDPAQPACEAARAAGVGLAPSAAAVMAHALDVLAPCAVGGLIDTASALALHCRIVCGAANNPLTGPGAADVLAARKILYVPDFLANCGGLVHVDAERRGETDPDALERSLDGAAARARAILLEAHASGRQPLAVAEDHAWARIGAARAAAIGAAA